MIMYVYMYLYTCLELPRDTPEQPWRADLPGGMEGRKDLRESHLVFSIDPKGCEDVDDALSVRYIRTSIC